MLQVTDEAKAWAEFDSLNVARIQAILKSSKSTTPPANSASSAEVDDDTDAVAGNLASSEDDVSSDDIKSLKYTSYVIMGVLVLVLILLVALIVMVAVSLRRAKRGGKGYRSVHDPLSVPLSHEKYATPYGDDGH